MSIGNSVGMKQLAIHSLAFGTLGRPMTQTANHADGVVLLIEAEANRERNLGRVLWQPVRKTSKPSRSVIARSASSPSVSRIVPGTSCKTKLQEAAGLAGSSQSAESISGSGS